MLVILRAMTTGGRDCRLFLTPAAVFFGFMNCSCQTCIQQKSLTRAWPPTLNFSLHFCAGGPGLGSFGLIFLFSLGRLEVVVVVVVAIHGAARGDRAKRIGVLAAIKF